MMDSLLVVEDLKTFFYTDGGVVRAVDGVSFTVGHGEVLGIVGESGCGKSIASMSIMRLIPQPPGRIEGGRVLLNGRDLLKISEKEMRRVRGNEMAMIFQEPMTSLNPVFTIGNQLTEAIRLHQGLKKKEAVDNAVEMLQLVGISRAREIVREYPHRLSGGMRQRVMIAMALSCNPRLLIADEPTTALDVTIQAQILELMKDLKQKINTGIIFITHDLGVIAEMSQRIMVMYAGKVVEEADAATLFTHPLHPYTRGLLNSKPRIEAEKDKLYSIRGMVPNPLEMPPGCYFNPRCDEALEQCRREAPPLIEVSPGHRAACWLNDGTAF